MVALEEEGEGEGGRPGAAWTAEMAEIEGGGVGEGRWRRCMRRREAVRGGVDGVSVSRGRAEADGGGMDDVRGGGSRSGAAWTADAVDTEGGVGLA